MKIPKILLAALFCLGCQKARALELNIKSPVNEAIISTGQTLTLQTQVLTSGYALKYVTATIAGVVYALDYKEISSGRYSTWGYSKDINLINFNPDIYEITFKTEDFSNNVAQKSIFIRVGSPPRFTSDKMEFVSAADGNLSVRVSAEDDNPGIKISLTCGSLKTEQQSSGTTINQVLSLNGVLAPTASITITNALGLSESFSFNVVNYTARFFTEQATFPHEIVDFDAERVLLKDTEGNGYIGNISNGQVHRIYEAKDYIPYQYDNQPVNEKLVYGYLHPFGAIFAVQGSSVLTAGVFDYRTGGSAEMISNVYNPSLFVNGIHAVLGSVSYRNLQTGTSYGFPGGNTEFSVTKNGTVYFWGMNPYTIYKWKGGQTTKLLNYTAEFSSGWSNFPAAVYPYGNDSFVTFKRRTSDKEELWLLENGVEAKLSDQYIKPIVSDAQVLFNRLQFGINQVWLRGSQGVERQVTFKDQGGSPVALANDGDGFVRSGGKLAYFDQSGIFETADSNANSLANFKKLATTVRL